MRFLLFGGYEYGGTPPLTIAVTLPSELSKSEGETEVNVDSSAINKIQHNNVNNNSDLPEG
jgi:hypothetical protein